MSKQTFSIDGKSVVVTSTYVTNEKMPILYVTHEFDEIDGDIWQFHCGNNDYDMTKMLLVSLNNILKIDGSITEVLDLPVNSVAKRNFIGDKWIYSKE